MPITRSQSAKLRQPPQEQQPSAQPPEQPAAQPRDQRELPGPSGRPPKRSAPAGAASRPSQRARTTSPSSSSSSSLTPVPPTPRPGSPQFPPGSPMPPSPDVGHPPFQYSPIERLPKEVGQMIAGDTSGLSPLESLKTLQSIKGTSHTLRGWVWGPIYGTLLHKVGGMQRAADGLVQPDGAHAVGVEDFQHCLAALPFVSSQYRGRLFHDLAARFQQDPTIFLIMDIPQSREWPARGKVRSQRRHAARAAGSSAGHSGG